MAEVKLDELENYDAENLQEERNDFVGDNGADADQMMEDPELEAIKARVREMEEEAEKLKMLQSEVEKQINSPQGVSKSYNSPVITMLNSESYFSCSQSTEHVYRR